MKPEHIGYTGAVGGGIFAWMAGGLPAMLAFGAGMASVKIGSKVIEELKR